MSRPSFKVLGPHRNLEEEIFIPPLIQLKDGRELKYLAEKKSGGTPGGFYVDSDGKKYIAKFSSYTSSPVEKKKSVPRSEYYEVMLNNIFRSVLGEKAAPAETLIGHYSDDDSHYPCFVASEVPGFRSLSSFGREEILGYADEKDEAERKVHRAKFHHFFPLICLVMNDDLYDDNFGIDAAGNPINIDLGLTPPFLFLQQQENISVVDQLASYISHNNPFGCQQFRRKFFDDVSYASMLEGVRLVLEGEKKLLGEVDKIITEISQDRAIDEEEKKSLITDFGIIRSAFEQRVKYFRVNFAQEKHEASDTKKWKDHQKFPAVLKSSRDFERKTAADAAIENIKGMAEILGIESDDIYELKKQILESNPSEKKSELQKFAKKIWALPLHVAAMNSDGAMVKWLLDNEIADVTQRYMKRAHNIEHRAHTALSIAVANFYDKQADGQDVTAVKAIVGILSANFFEKVPQALEDGYEKNPDVIWPLRMTKLCHEQYRRDTIPQAALLMKSAQLVVEKKVAAQTPDQ